MQRCLAAWSGTYEFQTKAAATGFLAPPGLQCNSGRCCRGDTAYLRRIQVQGLRASSPRPRRPSTFVAVAASIEQSLEAEVHSHIDLPSTVHRGRLPEERRRQRAAISDIVGTIGQVLDLHEHL